MSNYMNNISSVAQGVAPTLRETPLPLPRVASSEVAPAVAPLEITGKDIKVATESINNFLQSQGKNLAFSVDEETGTTVVKVIDTQTKEVIRQMPTKEALVIAQALDKLQGLIFRAKA